MKGLIDFQVHTTMSDGLNTPEEVVFRASQSGVKFLSITDHDTTGAYPEVFILAKQAGIKVVPGVELSVTFNSKVLDRVINFDVLGYGIDVFNDSLQEKLWELRRHRQERLLLMTHRLNQRYASKGFSFSEEELVVLLDDRCSVGRPHLARLMASKGLADSPLHAFNAFLKDCDVPKKSLSLKDASMIIRNAGGKLFLAHPGSRYHSISRVTTDFDKQRLFFDEVSEFVDGIEAFYWDHSEEQSFFYEEEAVKRGWLVSGGSDHHGGYRDRLGRFSAPSKVLDYFKEFLEKDYY